MTVRLTSSHGSWALPNGTTVFGRSKSCDICLLDSRLSRRHAGFHVDHSRAYVEDLGSTNGVLLNGERTSGRHEVVNGDQLVIGPCVITVVIDPTMRPSEVLRALTPGLPSDKLPAGGEDTDIMNPVLPEPGRGHGSPGRHVDPAIAAATGAPPSRGQTDTDRLRPDEYRSPSTEAVSPRRRSTTSTHKPSDLPVTNESALAAAHDLAATVADDPPLLAPIASATPKRTPSTTEAAPASTANPFASATTVTAPAGRRILAGGLDAGQAVLVALALALPPLVAGYVVALRAAGAVLRNGLPRLSFTPDQPATMLDLAGTLLHPGALPRSLEIAGELQQHSQYLPAIVLFTGVTVAVLAFMLTLLLMTVVASVLRGGPLWHRRLGLAIIDTRTGAWPGWGRALARWSLFAVLWPLALVTACLGRVGVHDRLSSCAVRPRPR